MQASANEREGDECVSPLPSDAGGECPRFTEVVAGGKIVFTIEVHRLS